MKYPPWVVLHVPHDSLAVPDSVRGQFLLSDSELRTELDRMTDHHTLALFADSGPKAQVVRAPVSRLVVDVERFEDDRHEPMASRGMGAVYSVTSDLLPLRRPLSSEERAALIREYYLPHHARLEDALSDALGQQGRCLVLDCHSFAGKALPYELAKPDSVRPDICIGTDDFHTSSELTDALVTEFERVGWKVTVNDPFAGALVPSSRYRRDQRVQAIMVEVNRRLYMHGSTGEPLPDLHRVAEKIRRCCATALNAYSAPR